MATALSDVYEPQYNRGTGLPAGYRPSANEEFMNPAQLAYFRQKLLGWKDEILRESQGTMASLKSGPIREADVMAAGKAVGLVDVKPLQELVAVLAADDIRRGYVITSGKFSVQARDFADLVAGFEMRQVVLALDEGRELPGQAGHADDPVEREAEVAVVAGASFVVVATGVAQAFLDVLLDGFGGSQGARAINEAMAVALPKLKELPVELRIKHQTGAADFEKVKAAYAAAATMDASSSSMPPGLCGLVSTTRRVRGVIAARRLVEQAPGPTHLDEDAQPCISYRISWIVCQNGPPVSVRMAGFEPARVAPAVFKTAASAIPPLRPWEALLQV